MIRDDIINLFTRHKDSKISNFMKNPCFACKNCIVETSDEEYSTDSWKTCQHEYSDYGIEIFIEHKKEFPICQAPNKCLRNGWFKGTIDTSIAPCFSIYDGIGYQLWHDLDNAGCTESPSIAGSILAFHRRLSEAKL